MRKIVMFTNTFHPMVGGLEKSVATFCEDLTEAGHFCRVVTLAFEGAEHSGNGILRLPAIRNLGEKRFSVRLPWANPVDHWMEAIQPDILHSHQPFMLGDTAWREARKRRIPLIFTHHTLYERYAHYLLLESAQARRLVLSLTTHYANRCNCAIAPTESIRKIMRERGITSRIEVIPTGIDVATYSHGDRSAFRKEVGIPQEAFVAGHLGRLSREKNITLLAEAARQFVRETPHAYFLMVGEGDEVVSTRQSFQDAGLGERLILPGVRSGPAVADAYAAMDCFLFASQTDTQGLVLLEAMAAGLPVIAIDAPGARDLIQHEKTGILLDAQAGSDQMTQALRELRDSPEHWRSLCEQAREVVLAHDRKVCSRRLLDLYNDLIETHKRESPAPSDSGVDHFLSRFEDEWTLLTEKFEATRSIWKRPDKAD